MKYFTRGYTLVRPGIPCEVWMAPKTSALILYLHSLTVLPPAPPLPT